MLVRRNIFNTPLLSDFFDDDFWISSLVNFPKYSDNIESKKTDNGYTVKLPAMGFDKDDITIELKENEVFVSGEVKESTPEFVRNRSFKHSWTIENLKTVNAKLENGILELEIEVDEPKKPKSRTVEIK